LPDRIIKQVNNDSVLIIPVVFIVLFGLKSLNGMINYISKIIFGIGALSAAGMIYLLLNDKTSKLFYILMLITLSSRPLAQYVSKRKKKDID